MYERRPGLGPMPTFPEFYRAINQRSPFPWQARLANQVARDEKWPVEIGVPTGLGKTACLDIAVWWLASQAHRLPEERTAPTRIWWLVNRRLLVDPQPNTPGRSGTRFSTRGREQSIAMRYEWCTSWQVASVRWPPMGTLIRWSNSPSWRCPVSRSHRPIATRRTSVHTADVRLSPTVSWLRFKSLDAPIDAALSGTDSLVLVDEAHLAKHLVRLVPGLAECTRNAGPSSPGRDRDRKWWL